MDFCGKSLDGREPFTLFSRYGDPLVFIESEVRLNSQAELIVSVLPILGADLV